MDINTVRNLKYFQKKTENISALLLKFQAEGRSNLVFQQWHRSCPEDFRPIGLTKIIDLIVHLSLNFKRRKHYDIG